MSSTKKDLSATCDYCHKIFQSASTRNRHLRTIHNDNSKNCYKSGRIMCPICPNTTEPQTFSSFALLMEHHTNLHQVKFEKQQLTFKTQDEFKTWKESVEKNTKSYYFLNVSRSVESTRGKVFYYECHRSNLGNFESKCVQRAPKISGSIKLDGVCTSRIRAEVNYDNDNVSVEYVATHVGHQLELRCQPLTESEKSAIVEQIRLGVSYNTILKKARSMENDDCTRLNLLTVKDINYLAEKHNLSGKRHKSDFIAVEMKVAEWNLHEKNVFFFKKIGEIHDVLDRDDFALAYTNKEMKYMLTTYGSRIICMDGTHGTNPYDFELTTMLILDDQHIGHLVLFLISNRKDTIIQQVVLNELKKMLGTLIPQYLMTDDTPIYYNAWNSVMGTIPQRLLCTWHVKKNWVIQCRSKVSDPEKRYKIQQDLTALLKETDKNEFLRIKNNLIKYLQLSNEYSILKYLETYYFQTEERITAWAHCYRIHAGINTNMHLEALHKHLKYNYFSGKTVRRLETCLDALDKLIVDKSWKRIGSVLRPTATHRDLLVNKFHKRAMAMSLQAVAEQSEDKFLVHSQSKIDFYEVEWINRICKCRTLRCAYCNICIHHFKCSCYESSVKNNFCKHMHLVAIYTAQKKRTDNSSITLDQPNEAKETSTAQSNLSEEITLRIAENSDQNIVDTDGIAEQCKIVFDSILNECSTIGDYQHVLKDMLEMKSRLEKDKANVPPVDALRKRKIQKQSFFPNKK